MNKNKIELTVWPNRKKKTMAKSFVSGNMDISTAKKLAKELSTEMKDYEGIHVILKDLRTIDFAGAQVLYSLKNTMIKSNKEITFESRITKEQTTLLDNSGFNELTIVI